MAGDLEKTELVMLTPGDFEEVAQLIERHFLKRNPLNIAANETSAECFGDSFGLGIKSSLESGFCVGAREKTTKKMVGLKLASVGRVDQLCTRDTERLRGKSVGFRILAMINVDAEMFQHVTSVLFLLYVCVHPRYCGRGLARMMVQVKTCQMMINTGICSNNNILLSMAKKPQVILT
nr:uncharacterized protein LOC128697601 [Cherax quadricarinatus]